MHVYTCSCSVCRVLSSFCLCYYSALLYSSCIPYSGANYINYNYNYLVCVSVCVCASVTQHLTFDVIIRATNDTNLMHGG